MTVSAATASETFACDGATTEFTCPFGVFASSELRGYLITIATGLNTPLSNGVDFTVGNVGEPNAVVTTTIAYSSAYRVKFQSRTERVQQVDFSDLDAFPAEVVEQALDRLTRISIEDGEALDRAIKAPDGETLSELPAAASRLGLLLGFDEVTGDIVLAGPSSGSTAAFALDLLNGADVSKGAAMVGQSLQVISTMAVLRTIAGSASRRLHLMGYSADNDGGQGIFYWNATSAAADDGGTVIVPTGHVGNGRWLRLITSAGPWSVRWFGVVADGVTNDHAAFSAAAATGKPLWLDFLGDMLLNGVPITVSSHLYGLGCDDGQTTITLAGTCRLDVGDEHAVWENFFVRSSVAAAVFIRCAFSYWRFSRFRLERTGGAAGQRGIEFNTTSRSVYQCVVDAFKTKVDYPVFITGAGAEAFNDNRIGGVGCYWQDFASAITTEQQVNVDGNEFAGYFETGTNMLAHNAGTLRQNRFRYVLDGVTRDAAITPAITDANLWERLDGGLFAATGTMPQGQVFIGCPVTKVRATQAAAQSINSGAATAITFDAEVFDTLSEFTPGSGLFTAKQTGYFRVRGAAMSASVAWDVGERWEVAIFKNAAEYARGIPSLADAATTRQRMSAVDCLVQLTVGDTLELMVLHNQGAAVNLNNSGLTNYLEIERVQ